MRGLSLAILCASVAMALASTARAQTPSRWGGFGYGRGNIKGADFDVEITHGDPSIWVLKRTTHRVRSAGGAVAFFDVVDWADSSHCPALNERFVQLNQIDWRAADDEIKREVPYLDAGESYIETQAVKSALGKARIVDQGVSLGPVDGWVTHTMTAAHECWRPDPPKN